MSHGGAQWCYWANTMDNLRTAVVKQLNRQKVMQTPLGVLADISPGWISHSIYISLYKCCIYKIDTRLILADCDLQQQQQGTMYHTNVHNGATWQI